MSEDKIKRRRFLADILFAGGAISAAALLAQATRPKPEPAKATPACAATPEPVLGGKPAQPQPPEARRAKGEMALPLSTPAPKAEAHLKGQVALPQHKKP